MCGRTKEKKHRKEERLRLCGVKKSSVVGKTTSVSKPNCLVDAQSIPSVCVCEREKKKSKRILIDSVFFPPFYMSEWINGSLFSVMARKYDTTKKNGAMLWMGNRARGCDYPTGWDGFSRCVCVCVFFGHKFGNKTKSPQLNLTYRLCSNEMPSTFLVRCSPDIRICHYHVPAKILFATSNSPSRPIVSPANDAMERRKNWKKKRHTRIRWK